MEATLFVKFEGFKVISLPTNIPAPYLARLFVKLVLVTVGFAPLTYNAPPKLAVLLIRFNSIISTLFPITYNAPPFLAVLNDMLVNVIVKSFPLA